MASSIWVLVLAILFISASASVQSFFELVNSVEILRYLCPDQFWSTKLVQQLNTTRGYLFGDIVHMDLCFFLLNLQLVLYASSYNPGLACIALQYIKAYQGDCGAVGGPNAKKPADSEFADTFAPNCGVEISTLTPITGRLLGCQSNYVKPSVAFSEILMKNEKSIEILQSKNHSEVGAAVSGSDGGGPYFWCALFSNGKSNNSFVLEGHVAKISRPGCFSGANDDCNGAIALSRTFHLWPMALTGLITLASALGI
ncbi:hypothetical protein Sango_2205800 [Sesamum angolense]|uniref:Uncharacterized protein n=1 Tax=Sesamum angolense TaxID=2727404 RepID=A0AAE1W8E0_9LAMI|nr:hypothetical protein Sango_2205800 [Sesamum angolense]